MKKDNYKKGLVLLCIIIIGIITIVGYYVSEKAETSINSGDTDIISSEDDTIEDSEISHDTEISEAEKTHEKGKIKVDISGCVQKPGLYELEAGARVDDIINMAGGFTDDVNNDYIAKNINRARLLQDEDKIYIPSINDDIDELERQASNSDSTYTSGRININTATKEQLMTLKGIGEAYADRIIEYRKKQKFSSIEDIMNVSGIGKKKFENIKEYIKVE